MTDAVRRRLVIALLLLFDVQLLHGLDELRTDPDATLLSVLLAPQGLAGLAGTLLTAAVVARRWAPWDVRLARLTAVLVALGFVIVHGLPWATPATAPYWGDGSADIIEWAGVIVILVLCRWVFALTRQTDPDAEVARFLQDAPG